MASFDYIRSYYGVPAKRGGRITYDGQPGTIIWTDGPYLRVRLDGKRGAVSLHPTWKVEYDTASTAGQERGEVRDGE